MSRFRPPSTARERTGSHIHVSRTKGRTTDPARPQRPAVVFRDRGWLVLAGVMRGGACLLVLPRLEPAGCCRAPGQRLAIVDDLAGDGRQLQSGQPLAVRTAWIRLRSNVRSRTRCARRPELADVGPCYSSAEPPTALRCSE
jgi:hypothetical protein